MIADRIYSDRTMSQMPEFIVAEELVSVPGQGMHYSVKCPRKKCGGSFLVRTHWKKPRISITGDTKSSAFYSKQCPYCGLTNFIPERLIPKKLRGRTGRLVRGDDYNEKGQRLDSYGDPIPESGRKIRTR